MFNCRAKGLTAPLNGNQERYSQLLTPLPYPLYFLRLNIRKAAKHL